VASTTYISAGRRRRRRALAVLWVALVLVVVAEAAHWLDASSPSKAEVGPQYAATGVAWPATGAAAFVVGNGPIQASGETQAVPVASLAKVMTAVVVLRAHPLSADDAGFTLSITDDDTEDTARRRGGGESVVAVAAGERLTERQALEALLLPSANNIAVVLARAVAGNAAAFVARMNTQARRIGMTATTYTDPSGLDDGTRSTARDQVLLARAAMKVPAFAAIVGLSAATLPVAGVITNTDTLLGRDGFVGVKTGSDQAAGGCFMFATRYRTSSGTTYVYGVVLGQRDGPFIAAGLQAAKRLANSVRTELAAGSSR
jgi:D-alanyl-D-alanine carboxypeptidase (penicillin-binding protein 5/6)